MGEKRQTCAELHGLCSYFDLKEGAQLPCLYLDWKDRFLSKECSIERGEIKSNCRVKKHDKHFHQVIKVNVKS